MARSASLIRKLLPEFLAIVVGVVVALAADDWRETREERTDVRESLVLVLSDLRSDSTQLSNLVQTTRTWDQTSAWLINNWDRQDLERDSLEAGLFDYSAGYRLYLSRGAFEGLQDSNRLRLVDDDELRASLRRHYQVRLPRLETLYLDLRRYFLAVHESLVPYVRNVAGEDPESLYPPSESRVYLRRPWTEIAQDERLHNDIVWLGRFSGFIADPTIPDMVDETNSLMAEIRRYLRHSAAGPSA